MVEKKIVMSFPVISFKLIQHGGGRKRSWMVVEVVVLGWCVFPPPSSPPIGRTPGHSNYSTLVVCVRKRREEEEEEERLNDF